MRGLKLLKSAAIVLAMLGIVLPPVPILASEQKTPARPTVKILAANSILDIKLGKDGSLTGRAVDHNGNAVVGTSVVVNHGKTEKGQSVTDERGNFAVQNLKPGVYTIGSGATIGTYRVWSEKTAPPSAMPHSLLVLGENGARGQYGLTETIAGENLGLILLAASTGLGLAALLVALHAKHTADAAESKSP